MYDAGAYLTRKLFVGSEVWSQGGSKLLHLDTKIHVLQGLSFHLEALESVGVSLLPASKEEDGEGGGGGVVRKGGGKNAPSAVQVGVEFARMLEEFEGVMDMGRTTLEKKVGSLGPMKPKARGAVSLFCCLFGRERERKRWEEKGRRRRRVELGFTVELVR